MTDIQGFDFHGDSVSVLRRSDGNWLFLRQLTNALELDGQAQQRKIERSAWSEGWIAVTAIQLPGDAQARQHVIIHERIAPMWLANITTSRIPDRTVRERVETYQREFADALHHYVTTGIAVRPGPGGELISLQDLPPTALRLLADEREGRQKVQRELETVRPFAAAWSELASKEGGLDWIEVALVLAPVTGGMGRTTLLRELRAMRIIQKSRPVPYATHAGRFMVKADAHGRRVGATTLVPAHSLLWLRMRLVKRLNPQDPLFELGEAS